MSARNLKYSFVRFLGLLVLLCRCAFILLAASEVARADSYKAILSDHLWSGYSWHNQDYYGGPLDNPGIGVVDFHDSYEKVVLPDNRSYDPKVLYYRWTWTALEPSDGVYNFRQLDLALDRARRENKTVAFRIMTVWQSSSPEWLLDRGVDFVEVNDGHDSKFPDHNSEIFLHHHFKLLEAISKHIDKVDRIEFIDVGSVGCWGEWHASCCKGDEVKRICQKFFPTNSNQLNILNKYHELFGKYKLIGLVAAPVAQFEKLKFGLRADCLGDMGFFSTTANHMMDIYGPVMSNDKIKNLWKSNPIAFENCFSFQDWLDRGFNVEFILDRALEWHISTLNTVNNLVPDQLIEVFENFRSRMGYRFYINSFYFPAEIDSAEVILFCLDVRNVGVAPAYRKFHANYRLVDKINGQHFKVNSTLDSRLLLPGINSHCELLPYIRTLPSGTYFVDFSLGTQIDLNDVYLSNYHSVGGGWYRLGKLIIR